MRSSRASISADPGSRPRRLGARALSVALSDLAGMGARPVWCAATLCAPASTCFEDVLEIQRGLCAAAAAAGCAVAGGDVSAIDGPLVIDVSVAGTLAPGAVLRRDGGRPGDLVVVTGTLGRAAAGLRLLLDGGDELSDQERAWVDAQLSPVARIAEGLQLVASGVRCGGDISDGLLVELERIGEMSGCGAEIWLDRLPVEPALVSDFGAAWPDLALGGGEDFELVAAAAGGGGRGARSRAGPTTSLRSRSSGVCATGPASTSSIRKEARCCRARRPARGTSRERRGDGDAMLDRGGDARARRAHRHPRRARRPHPAERRAGCRQDRPGSRHRRGHGHRPDAGAISPTFVLHHVYRAGAKVLHHIDLYRLGPDADIRLLDIDEMLESGGVVVVEWGEHAGHKHDARASIRIDIDDDGSRVISPPSGAPSRLTDAWNDRGRP